MTPDGAYIADDDIHTARLILYDIHKEKGVDLDVKRNTSVLHS
ncbi:5620_t:CDS:2 [Acaulospora morrowiae]|uniref:5620_t:CDS:1 n=1 Tax=Acaulospora morrowiae TaxID=94023 RepID=A0A9N8YV66_9GLOM|nr:5620_t:CDS:2 [Acaulospora morrowiae]